MRRDEVPAGNAAFAPISAPISAPVSAPIGAPSSAPVSAPAATSDASRGARTVVAFRPPVGPGPMGQVPWGSSSPAAAPDPKASSAAALAGRTSHGGVGPGPLAPAPRPGPEPAAAAALVMRTNPSSVGPGPIGQVAPASPDADGERAPSGPAPASARTGAAGLAQVPATPAVPVAADLAGGAFFPAGGLSKPRGSAPLEEALVGRVLDQRYRIEEQIGEGGMGVVYKARHVIIDKPLAIKLLRSEHASQADVVKRFLLEAQLASRVKHPNIVDISDYGQIPSGTAYYVMEFLTGETLADRIDRLGKLEPALALDIAVQIAQGLAAAHAGKIIHRDLKSENIFLCEAPGGLQVKILDFGIARITDKKTRLTASGALIGTPAYMSPEQAQGQEADERSDLYALGIILFEMLAGQVPFKLPTVAMVLSAQIFDTPPSLREVDAASPDLPNVEHFIRMLLAKNRDERPQSANEAIGLLRTAAELDASASASTTRRRPTITLGSWSVAEGAPHEVPPPSALVVGPAAPPGALQTTMPVPDVGDPDAAVPRGVTASGRIERRPSVIVQRGTAVERIAPPPATHRPSTGEIAPRGAITGTMPAPRSGGPPTLLIVAAAASIGAAITVTLYKQYYRRPATPTPAAIVAPPTPIPPVMTVVHLTFDSEPPGAQVLREGTDLLGTTPYVLEAAPGGPERRYVFRLPGYEDATAEVAPGRHDERVKVILRPRAPAPPNTVASPPSSPAPTIEEASPEATTAAKDPTAESAVTPGTGATRPKTAAVRGSKPRPPADTPPPNQPEQKQPAPATEEADMGELKNPFRKK